jgi:hypothetical protein
VPFIRFVVPMVLGIVLPLVVQRAWLRRLSEERRAQAWNGASWAAALYAFGPLSMLGFCWVTRRRPGALRALISLAAGLASTCLVVGCIVLVDLGLEALLGDASDPYGR